MNIHFFALRDVIKCLVEIRYKFGAKPVTESNEDKSFSLKYEAKPTEEDNLTLFFLVLIAQVFYCQKTTL